VSHPRKLIRDTVRDLLDGETDAKSRVYASRIIPYREIELPAISVYTLDESSTADNATQEITRELELVIEGIVAIVDPMRADDELDALAEQIEAAMDEDIFLKGDAGYSYLASTSMEILDDSDRLVGLVTLTYTVTYHTPVWDQPDAHLKDFLRVKATHAVNSVPTGEQVEDDFTVQEAP